ncbi:MAG: DNA polymerase III subunit epsilon [Oxalobacter sp.]|nr:DNA polymerase III subunit epsilon [Oxalobacter sp.]
MTRQIVLDTETTGLEANNGDRVVEIGCVEVIDRRITDNHFHVYINPERDIPEDAVKIHGLTAEFLSDKPVFAAIAQSFCDFIKGSELIIHNASFDVGFLDAELKRLKMPPVAKITTNVVDSLAMAKQMFPGKRNNLDVLCERFEIDNSQRTLHGALLDAELLAEVYLGMTRGQNSLMIDDTGDDDGNSAGKADAADNIPIIVLGATEEELAAHEAVLQGIEKENKGKACLWRNGQPDSQAG